MISPDFPAECRIVAYASASGVLRHWPRPPVFQSFGAGQNREMMGFGRTECQRGTLNGRGSRR